MQGMLDVDVEFERGKGGMLDSADDPHLRPGGMPAPADERGPFTGERVEVPTQGVGSVRLGSNRFSVLSFMGVLLRREAA